MALYPDDGTIYKPCFHTALRVNWVAYTDEAKGLDQTVLSWFVARLWALCGGQSWQMTVMALPAARIMRHCILTRKNVREVCSSDEAFKAAAADAMGEYLWADEAA